MRQNSKVEPSTLSSPAIALHPVLSLALVNLDMQLEDELVRYRRQRANAGRAVPQSRRTQPSQQLDLIAVAATSDRNSANTAQPTPALEDRLIDVAGQPIAPDTYKPIPAFTANPQPFDAAIALRTPAKSPMQGGSADSSLAAGDEGHAITPAANPNLDDYLESSEELLRSLADEQAEVRAERNFMQSLLTPLGLGSMLLLLLSSAMFGYVIMNPSSLGSLAKLNQPPSSTGQPQGTAALPLPPNPTNSALPFLDPNNLGVLDPGRSSLPSSIQPTVTPTGKPTIASPKTAAPTSPVGLSRSEAPSAAPQAPIPAVTSAPSRPSTVMRTLEPSRPAPRRFAPAQAPVATVRPALVTNPSAASSSNGAGAGSYQYKVGVPFENDQTLENARKVVPDAFVRTLPDGRTIVQLGAARSETEVKANVQKLHDQGLPSAEVYKR